MARRADAPTYKPTTWTKTVNGTVQERTATTVEDEVKLRFDGWQPKNKADATAAEDNAAAAAAATAKPANQK